MAEGYSSFPAPDDAGSAFPHLNLDVPRATADNNLTWRKGMASGSEPLELSAKQIKWADRPWGESRMTPTDFEELAPLARTLREESDNLNETITAINTKLAELNLGIEVWYPSSGEAGVKTEIGFGKPSKQLKSSWELCIRQDWGQIEISPLLNASRDLRIEGLKMVPNIISSLKVIAQDKIRVMREAKKLASQL